MPFSQCISFSFGFDSDGWREGGREDAKRRRDSVVDVEKKTKKNLFAYQPALRPLSLSLSASEIQFGIIIRYLNHTTDSD